MLHKHLVRLAFAAKLVSRTETRTRSLYIYFWDCVSLFLRFPQCPVAYKYASEIE